MGHSLVVMEEDGWVDSPMPSSMEKTMVWSSWPSFGENDLEASSAPSSGEDDDGLGRRPCRCWTKTTPRA